MGGKKLDGFRLALCLAVPLAVGFAAGNATRTRTDWVYSLLHAPPLALPQGTYILVWTVLYVLMGIALYRVTEGHTDIWMGAAVVFGMQLLVSFTWPVAFFLALRLGTAAILSVMLVGLVAVNAYQLWKIDRTAGWLMAPYVLWSGFAAYLSIGFWYLNRGLIVVLP